MKLILFWWGLTSLVMTNDSSSTRPLLFAAADIAPVCNCTYECKFVLDEAKLEWDREFQGILEKRDSVIRQELNSSCEEKLRDKSMEFFQHKQEAVMKRVNSTEVLWRKKYDRMETGLREVLGIESKYRKKCEDMYRELQLEHMEQSGSDAVVKMDFRRMLERSERNTKRERELVKETQTSLDETKQALEHETKLRQDAEALAVGLQEQLDAAAEAYKAAEEDLKAQLESRMAEIEQQKEHIKSIQASQEETTKHLLEAKDKFFESRRELLQANQQIRDMEAKATYVNVSMMIEDTRALLKKAADHVRPAVSVVGERYEEHAAPFVDRTIRPAVDPVLAHYYTFQQFAFKHVSSWVKHSARSAYSYLDKQEGDSKIRSYLMGFFQSLETHSDAAVEGMKNVFYASIYVWLPWVVWRWLRRPRKSQETAANMNGKVTANGNKKSRGTPSKKKTQ
jgi:hypothetical protein